MSKITQILKSATGLFKKSREIGVGEMLSIWAMATAIFAGCIFTCTGCNADQALPCAKDIDCMGGLVCNPASGKCEDPATMKDTKAPTIRLSLGSVDDHQAQIFIGADETVDFTLVIAERSDLAISGRLKVGPNNTDTDHLLATMLDSATTYVAIATGVDLAGNVAQNVFLTFDTLQSDFCAVHREKRAGLMTESGVIVGSLSQIPGVGTKPFCNGLVGVEMKVIGGFTPQFIARSNVEQAMIIQLMSNDPDKLRFQAYPASQWGLFDLILANWRDVPKGKHVNVTINGFEFDNLF